MTQTANQYVCQAREMAEKAAGFYEKAVNSCGDAVGKEMFSELLARTLKVKDQVAGMEAALLAGKDWEAACTLPEAGDDLLEHLREVAVRHAPEGACETELATIDTALQMEQAATAFFQQWLDAATAPKEKEYVERMIKERRAQHAMLAGMQSYYEDPESWTLREHKGGLDGA